MHGVEKLQCDLCDFRSISQISIWKHKKRIHDSENKYDCSHCDYTTNESATHLRYHVKRKHSSVKDLQCDECEYKASVNANLIRHKRRNHDTFRIKCTSCNFIGTRAALIDHMSNIHGDMKQCNDCDYKARRSSSMFQHQRAKHQGVSFHCGECDSKFESEGGLKLHTDNKHREIRFKCPKCDYMATMKGNLKIHEQALHENIKYPCSGKCSYIASTPRSLSWHSQKCKWLNQ